jgi:hypothetical protein
MKYNFAYDTFLKIKEILEDELIDDSNNLLLTPFNLPSALGGGNFGLVMPNPNFYYQIVIILLLQTSVAALLAIPLYHFVIIPQREKKNVHNRLEYIISRWTRRCFSYLII